MEPYDLEKLVSETDIKEYFGKLSTNEQAHIAITGYIEINSNDNKSPNKFLNEIATIVPPDRWLEFFIRCGRYASLSDDFIKSVSIAEKTIDDGKVNTSNVLENFFPALEKLYIEKKQVFKSRNLLRKTAGYTYKLTKDTRYKLFRDYAYIYTSEDKDELIDAVNQLETHLNSCVCDRDKRSIFYIQCLAITRILRLYRPFDVNEERIEGVYKDCLEKKHDWYSSSDDCFKKYYLFGRMKKYNCPEVARIFENSDMYIDAYFYRTLRKEVQNTLDKNKYSSEKPPIVSDKIVFLSKEMIEPEFSRW